MRPQRTTTVIALIAVPLLAAIVLLLWALTQPRFVTGPTETVVSWITGRDASIEAAWLSYRGGPEFHVRAIAVPERLEAERIDIVPNLLGLLPTVPMMRHVRAGEGAVLIDLTGGSMSSNYHDYIDRVSLSGLDVTVMRDTATSRLHINEASGSLHGGTLTIDATAGEGELFFEGDGKLAILDTIDGSVTIRGPNLATVAEALGIAAPDVPPFEISGHLAINRNAWVLTDIGGHIGESDINGALTVEFDAERPRIVGDLSSGTLDFDDVGIIVGLPSRNEDGAPLNEAQQRANAEYAQSMRFIPDAVIDRRRLAVVDADITYVADQVVDAPWPVSSFTVDMTLEDRLVTFEKLQAILASGSVSLGGTVLNARKDPAETDLNAALEGLDLATLVPDEMVRGTLRGDADLMMWGNNFHTAFANSTGKVVMWTSGAEIAAIPIEAVGLDLGELFATIITENDSGTIYVDAPCVVAALDVKDGIGHAAPIVADTEDSLLIADGTVSLRNETFNLDLSADAKDASWGSILGDIAIDGSWRHPAVNVQAEETVIQAVFAGLLGSIAAPLAALPFIETGDGEGVDCSHILQRAGTRETGTTQEQG